MKNHKGTIATLLTLGLVVLATAITLGSSLFVSNQKTNLASNSRATESSGPCEEGQNCGSGNQWLCKPNATKVEFNKKEFDGNGCNPTICKNKAMPFECYVIDNRCGGEIRSRFFGCLGQPCQNTVISQGSNGPGRLVGKDGLTPGECPSTVTPSITPVETNTPVPESTNTLTPTNTPTPTVVVLTSVATPTPLPTGMADNCSTTDNYGCSNSDPNYLNCPDADGNTTITCGSCNRTTDPTDIESDGILRTYRCVGARCHPLHLKDAYEKPQIASLNLYEKCVPDNEKVGSNPSDTQTVANTFTSTVKEVDGKSLIVIPGLGQVTF